MKKLLAFSFVAILAITSLYIVAGAKPAPEPSNKEVNSFTLMTSHPIQVTSTITWCGWFDVGYEANAGTGGATTTKPNHDNMAIVPANQVWSNLYFQIGAAQGGGNSVYDTLYRSTDKGVTWQPTSLTVTITDPATDGVDSVHRVQFNAGDYITSKVKATGGTMSAGTLASVKIETN